MVLGNLCDHSADAVTSMLLVFVTDLEAPSLLAVHPQGLQQRTPQQAHLQSVQHGLLNQRQPWGPLHPLMLPSCLPSASSC